MKRNLLLSLSFIFCALFAFGQVSEDFENGLPEGWTGENAWRFGTSSALSSAYFPIPEHSNIACVNDDDLGNGVDGSGRLITNTLDLTNLTGTVVLSHAAFFFDADYGGADETAKVLISDNGGSTWNTVTDLGGVAGWQSSKVLINDYAGKEVLVAFEYTDGNAWNYGYCVDDFSISVVENAKDVVLTNVSAVEYIRNDQDVPVSLTIENVGYEEVTSFTVTVSDLNGNAVSTDVSPVDPIVFGDTYSFDVTSSFDVSETKSHMFNVVISNINGADDQDMTNNSGEFSVTSIANAPAVKMVAEEATGTWCQWCPRGAVWMEYMAETYPDNFIGIAVHNNDPMTLAEYDTALGNTPGFSGYPSVVVEREFIIDPSVLEDIYTARANRVSPFGTSFVQEWDAESRTINVTATASIHTDLQGDYRLSLVITEDHVTGTESGYNQANAYAGGNAGTLNGWENLPNPVPAADMVYQQVARAIVGGHGGVAESMPSTLANGDEVSYDFTYELPATYDEKEIDLIVLVIDASTGKIMNGTDQKLNLMTSSTPELPSELASVTVSPNPSNDVANLKVNVLESSNVRLELIDMYGKLVNTRTFNNILGEQIFPIVKGNLPSGTYIVRLSTNGKSVSQKVTFID